MGDFMIKFKIVAVGNIKEDFLRQGIAEYSKRINKYAKCEIIECAEGKLNPNPSATEIASVLEKESDAIIKNLEGYSILCDLNCKQLTSEEMAENIKQITNTSSTITFVIGSSYGVSDKVRKAVNTSLSFSKATFPHMLMRVLLLEQIYRSLSIINNASYHK